MAMQRRTRVPMDEQVRIINECRTSGMTDKDWCEAHDIPLSTFYNWVSRCRKKESAKIPAPGYGHCAAPQPTQDIVPINIVPQTPEPLPVNSARPNAANINAHIEVSMGDITLRIHNEADPALLSQTLQLLRRLSC